MYIHTCEQTIPKNPNAVQFSYNDYYSKFHPIERSHLQKLIYFLKAYIEFPHITNKIPGTTTLL